MHNSALDTREYVVKKITHRVTNIDLMNMLCPVLNQKVMRDGEYALS